MEPAVATHRPRVAVPCGCLLGEGPVWDPRTGTLFWVDIKGRALFRWQPGEGGEAERRGFDDPVCFVQPTPDEDVVLLGLGKRLVRYGFSAGREPEAVAEIERDRPGNRLNDAAVGPHGSLWFGTQDDGETERTGAFYRWTEGRPVPFGAPVVIANGPVLDPDRGFAYATDTRARRIYRHAIEGDGSPGPRELFIQLGEGDGHPDGAALDEEGHLWVCHYGAARVTRFSPEGDAVLTLAMPTAQITKAAFGGPDLGTLYVTSGSRGRDPETDPLAGHLFAIELGIRGRQTPFCVSPGPGRPPA